MTDDKLPARAEVLHEAAGLITGDRNQSYGTPTQNFTNIGELWTTRLRHKLAPGQALTASDVADLMILLKIARNITDNKRDNYVDIAGYAGCGHEAAEAERITAAAKVALNNGGASTSGNGRITFYPTGAPRA